MVKVLGSTSSLPFLWHDQKVCRLTGRHHPCRLIRFLWHDQKAVRGSCSRHWERGSRTEVGNMFFMDSWRAIRPDVGRQGPKADDPSPPSDFANFILSRLLMTLLTCIPQWSLINEPTTSMLLSISAGVGQFLQMRNWTNREEEKLPARAVHAVRFYNGNNHRKRRS